MPTPSTLQLLTFQSMSQFVTDLNQNLAIIQNSPLFKGIPGEEGDPGATGQQGSRGSRFVFVNQYSLALIDAFPIISNITDVTLPFLNTNINNFDNNVILMDIFGLDALVDKDVIVLSDTLMLSYDKTNNQLVNTGQYFSEETNLTSNINNIVNQLIADAISNLSASILTKYSTLGKSFADSNSLAITSEITPTTAYSPYIPTVNNELGININNHKYISFTDYENEINTTIFGSVKKFYDMLHNTVRDAVEQSFNSQYVPGVNNIPKMIMMQNDDKNGFYFGRGDVDNLFSYASFFKDKHDNVVFKSHSSPLDNEYSLWKMSVHEWYYNKNVRVGNELYAPVSKITEMFNRENFYGRYLGDADTAYDADYELTWKNWQILNNKDGINFNADKIWFRKQASPQANVVLTLDNDGLLLNTFVVESEYNDYSALDGNTRTLATGQHIYNLWSLINDVNTALEELINSITDGTASLYIANLIIQEDLTLIKHKNKTLTTDADGKVVGTYSKPEGQLTRETIQDPLPPDTEYVNNYVGTNSNGYNDFQDDKSILTGEHGNLFMKLFRAIIARVNDIWTTLTDGTANINVNNVTVNNDLSIPEIQDKMLSTDDAGTVEGVYRKPEDGFTRSLTTAAANALSQEEYIDKFFEGTTPPHDYVDLHNASVMSGKHGNHIIEMFRRNSGIIFHKEVRWIGGTIENNPITNDLLPNNWFIADGDNGTDDLRGRFMTSVNTLNTDENPIVRFPYNTRGEVKGRYYSPITESNLPSHDHIGPNTLRPELPNPFKRFAAIANEANWWTNPDGTSAFSQMSGLDITEGDAELAIGNFHNTNHRSMMEVQPFGNLTPVPLTNDPLTYVMIAIQYMGNPPVLLECPLVAGPLSASSFNWWTVTQSDVTNLTFNHTEMLYWHDFMAGDLPGIAIPTQEEFRRLLGMLNCELGTELTWQVLHNWANAIGRDISSHEHDEPAVVCANITDEQLNGAIIDVFNWWPTTYNSGNAYQDFLYFERKFWIKVIQGQASDNGLPATTSQLRLLASLIGCDLSTQLTWQNLHDWNDIVNIVTLAGSNHPNHMVEDEVYELQFLTRDSFNWTDMVASAANGGTEEAKYNLYYNGYMDPSRQPQITQAQYRDLFIRQGGTIGDVNNFNTYDTGDNTPLTYEGLQLWRNENNII